MKKRQFVRLCECGCGQPTSIATMTDSKAGRVKGQPCRFVFTHHGASRPRRPLEERFRERFVQGESDECWLWAGTINNTGYGVLKRGGTDHVVVLAHRLAVQLDGREIPEGLVIDHLCRVRHCVNPAHLEIVTNRENVLRGVSPPSQEARKTHCKYGHPLSGENLAHASNGRGRICRACRKRNNDARPRKLAA